MILFYFGLFSLLFLIGLTISISNSKGVGNLITVILAFIGGTSPAFLGRADFNLEVQEFGLLLMSISFGTLAGYYAGYKFRLHILDNHPQLPKSGNFLGFLIPYSKQDHKNN